MQVLGLGCRINLLQLILDSGVPSSAVSSVPYKQLLCENGCPQRLGSRTIGVRTRACASRGRSVLGSGSAGSRPAQHVCQLSPEVEYQSAPLPTGTFDRVPQPRPGIGRSQILAPFAKERGTGVAPSAHRKAVTLRGWRVRKRPTLESRVTLLSPRCSHPLAGHDAVPAISKADSHGGLSNVWMIMTMPWRTVCRTLMPCVEPCLRVVWKRDTASLGDGEDTERSTERALRRSCVAANRWRRVPASMQQSVVRMTTWSLVGFIQGALTGPPSGLTLMHTIATAPTGAVRAHTTA